MARVFITGSSDGLGLLAARMLVAEGHEVVAHARSAARADATKQALPEAEAVLVADLSDREETEALADAVNTLGRFDAIIHNAGVYRGEKPEIFAVNVLAPYILTARIERPERLIYIGSNMHPQGSADVADLSLDRGVGYADSKLLVLMLAKAAARQWPECFVNTVDPGWVPTKMGGPGASDDLEAGAKTQVWLASNADAAFSGRYLFHGKEAHYAPGADDEAAQKWLIERCRDLSGIDFT